MKHTHDAILVVSFGTSAKQTGISAIEQIEARIRDAFPSYSIYRAWTSDRIRKKLQEQRQLHICSVTEALEQMKLDGIRNVIIQPTFVIDGEESQRMHEEALAYAGDFLSFRFGAPLLSCETDAKTAATVISAEAPSHFSYTNDDLVVFMGHGAAKESSADSDAMYALVDGFLQQSGHTNMVLRLMNVPGSMDGILELASAKRPDRIILVPFMIAAGHHAQKDMAGEQESSWASVLSAAGYSVHCVMNGLGEYEGIQNLFLDHIRDALQ